MKQEKEMPYRKMRILSIVESTEFRNRKISVYNRQIFAIFMPHFYAREMLNEAFLREAF